MTVEGQRPITKDFKNLDESTGVGLNSNANKAKIV